MGRNSPSTKDALVALEISRLRQENATLAEQVKQLIRVEGKRYEYQGELDAQLLEYKELYELNRKINSTFDINKVFGYAIDYVIQKLEYEKVVFFERFSNALIYSVCAAEGYNDLVERNAVASLTIRQDAQVIAPLMAGEEYLICCADSEAKDLLQYRAKLYLDEY